MINEEFGARSNNTSAGVSFVDTSAITESLNRLCNHSVTSTAIPRFDSYSDVYDFIGQFERVTSTLTDDQKLMVLPKAFPVDCYRSWYGTELAPLIKAKAAWTDVRDKIISRFSATGIEDKYFLRLKELKFDPELNQNLLSFVEDTLYSYKRAYPHEPDTSALKYVKLSLPPSLRAKLNLYADFKNAQDINTLKAAVKDYDLAKGMSPKKIQNRDSTQELTNIVKELVNNVRKETQALREENMAIRKEVTAAISSRDERKPKSTQNFDRPHSPATNNDYYRQKSPDHREYRQPRRQQEIYAYEREKDRQRSPYRGRSPFQGRSFHREAQIERAQKGHEQQGFYSNTRAQSPANNYAGISSRYYNRPSTPYYEEDSRNMSVQNEAFDSKAYYAKFGKPSSPCGTCGCMHWSRHCIDHLN